MRQFKKIYIDMDGVLVDFDGWKDAIPGLTDANVWEHALKVDHFYLNLAPMQEADALMDFLKSLETPLAILTGIPRRGTIPSAVDDKREWIQIRYPGLEFNIGPYAQDKQHFSKPDFLLIDDNPKNISQWISRGGQAILYSGLEHLKRELHA